MKKVILLSGLILAASISYSQIDVGITGLKVLEPREYNHGDVLQDNDTIEKIRFNIHNYGNAPVQNSDFGNQGVPIIMKYNNDSVMIYSYLIAPIQPGDNKVEIIPESHSSPHLFPDFPESATEDVVVCVRTAYQDDVDHSNDANCITLHRVSTSAELKASNNSGEMSIKSTGRNLLFGGIESTENIHARIFDLSGRFVTELRGSVESVESTDLGEKLIGGLYLVQIQTAAGETHSEKVFFK